MLLSQGLGRNLVGLVVAGLGLTLPACQNEMTGDEGEPPANAAPAAVGGDVAAPSPAASPPGSAPAPSAASLTSDRQIAAVDLELDNRAVVMGAVAGARAERGDVRLYVIHMVTDNGATSRRVAAIVQSAEMNPEDSALRRQLGSETGQLANSLWAAPRATFDRVYIDMQVAMHLAAAQMLTSLIAQTQDAVLQAELHDQMDTLNKQLADARALQASIVAEQGAAPPSQTVATP